MKYIKESYNELVNKVTWPTWSSLQGSAALVMITSLIFALIIFAMDFVFQQGLEGIYSILY
ncbi:MAG: preprotein translocase subunit SecE [Prevotellaceae bacterium]|jgi:preprotein translocase subunit SecE|nr:preprotein translocase subunit SecE [Prevotellaceae bacterium]